ncbi:MAG: hypothetical protein M1816_005625 [Peltula sp. TS41687]|nr:MAG: hypothetical protein M1816_005625 [Peltula sp. TS41687]
MGYGIKGSKVGYLGTGNVGTKEKLLWVAFVTAWGGLGSLLDSVLGGWLQASIVDVRTGKVVEGHGGRKVPVGATRFLRRLQKATPSKEEAAQDLHQVAEQIRQTNAGDKSISATQSGRGTGRASRHVESGLDLLDNNAINFLMALIMSVGGMLAVAWYWKVPLQDLLL